MKKNIMHYLLYFFIFFPFIQLVRIGSDQQPYALIISMIIVLLYTYGNGKIPNTVVVLLMVACASMIIGIVDGISMVYIRSVANYLSVFFITFAVYIDLKRNRMVNEKFIKAVILIWLFIGIIQKYIYKEFLICLISASRTSPDRGVTSLAVEPTMYGIVCIFLLIICWEFIKKRKPIYIIACIYQILFLAQSAMASVLLLFLLFCIIMIYGFSSTKIVTKIKIVIISTITILVSYNLIVNFLEGTRIQRLIISLINNPIEVLLTDASVNDRVSHIYFSIMGFLNNYFLPYGFTGWSNYVTIQLPKQTIFFWVGTGGRIMSGYGAVLFELGIIGLILILCIIHILINYNANLKKRLVYTIFLSAIMFTALPIAFPLFSFILGTFVYYNKPKKQKNKLKCENCMEC